MRPSLILRVGIAITFLYAAIASLINPNAWVAFIPLFIRNIFPVTTLLFLFSIYQIILSVWLISGKKLFYSSILSSITLFFIMIFNLGALDIVFRDLAILFSSIALAVSSYK